jgi:hypothetical protein
MRGGASWLLECFQRNPELFPEDFRRGFSLKDRRMSRKVATPLTMRRIQLRDGTAFAVPKSMAFTKMDPATFSKFMDEALTFLTTEVIPGLNREDLMREVEEMLGVEMANA